MKKFLSILMILATMMPSLALGAGTTYPNGGTGQTQYATGDMLYFGGVSLTQLSKLTIGSEGNCLVVSGGLPAWSGSCGGGGGSSTALDLGDNGSNESSGITEIATSGDTNSIFSEPSADKLLINLANDWPKSDTSDDLTCTDCIGATEITDIYVLNTGDTMTGDLELDGDLILNVDDTGVIRFSENDANGSNFKGFTVPAAITTSTTCTFEDDANFIPDSCVGDGVDQDSGGNASYPIDLTNGSQVTGSWVGSDNGFTYWNGTNLDKLPTDSFYTDGTNVYIQDGIWFNKNSSDGNFSFEVEDVPAGQVNIAKIADYGSGSSYTGYVPFWTAGSIPTPGNCVEVGATSYLLIDAGSPCGSGGSGAPDDADYLVGTANGSLSAEIVVGTTPGGELGGTWASPTLDDSVTTNGWIMGTFSGTQLTSSTVLADLLDAVGAVDMDYGSADVTDHTFVTDGTGTAEIVLPAGSIDGTEILNDTVALTTDTSGNYVSSATSNGGLTMTGTEGGSLGVLLPAATNALSSTTSSGSGLELLSAGLTLLQGCADTEILKWNESSDVWACAADANSGSSTAWDAIGDPSGNGTVAFGGTTQTITGNTNDVTAIGQDLLLLSFTNDAATDASTQRGLVVQNEASANGMESLLVLDNLDTDTAVTKGLLISSAAGAIVTALDVSDPQIDSALMAGANDLSGTNWSITGSTGTFSLPVIDFTGTGTINGLDAIDSTSESTLEAAIDIAGDVTGTGLNSVVVAANAVALTTDTTGNYVSSATSNGGLTLTGTEGASLGILLPAATDALSSTTSSGSGLELLSSGLTLLQGCSDGQVLAWVEATDLWSCSSAGGGSGDITSVGDVASGAAFDGTAGTILTFNDADGDKTLEYDNTNNWFEFNATLNPAANDGAALGNTTQQWSDLFLAEGGVLNWDNGDATMTQTGNDVTFAGISTFGVGTSTAVTLGTIELGAASDTTIARSAAGAATLEGVAIDTASNTLTLSNKTIAASSNVLDACVPVAVTDEYSDLTTGTAKATFRMPFAMTVTSVRASLVTVATGGTLVTVDINEAGTTILSTKLTFDASEKTTTTAATAAVVSDSSLADDAEMTVDIDAVGNTTPGNGLKISICGTI